MMGLSDERIVENNRLFREANERIRATSSRLGDPVERIPFLCECALENCTTVVRLTTEDYASIRDNEQYFFAVTGHEENDLPVAEVVARHGHYVIVEKKSG